MGRVGIVAALPSEARCLSPEVDNRDGPAKRASGSLLTLVSGVGSTNAEQAARAMLGRGATALASWGCAAGLVPQLSPGSLILAESVIDAEGHVYRAHAEWRHAILERLQGHLAVRTGPLADTPVPLSTPRDKEALGRRTSALAADMESAAVAAVGREAQVPFLVVRAVADPMGWSLPPAALRALDGGQVRIAPLCRSLVRRPWDLIPLVRLALGFRTALRSLADAARFAGDGLLFPCDRRLVVVAGESADRALDRGEREMGPRVPC